MYDAIFNINQSWKIVLTKSIDIFLLQLKSDHRKNAIFRLQINTFDSSYSTVYKFVEYESGFPALVD